MKPKFQFLYNQASDDGSSGGGGGAAGATLLDPPASGSQGQTPPSWIGDGGVFNHDALPQELQSYEALRTLKDVPSLAKAFGETKKLVGTKFTPPAPDAPEAQIAEWKKTLGAPLKPEEYEVIKDGLPDGAAIDETLYKSIAEVAHKHHIPTAAWKDIVTAYNKSAASAVAQSSTQQSQADQAFLAEQTRSLKEAWGNDFDKNKMAAAKVASIAGIAIDHPALQFADVVKGLATLSAAFSETSAASLVPTNGSLGGGRAQAQSIINDKANPLNKAYWETSHPNHQSTVAMVQNLMKQS
jgi:hypothetical protein